ncbi:hypothetical protein Ancab_017018, partial [Ancistrocladus abbreviatus]
HCLNAQHASRKGKTNKSSILHSNDREGAKSRTTIRSPAVAKKRQQHTRTRTTETVVKTSS